MGAHGYRSVTFCQNAMIFGGGSKAEVLLESAVRGYKCFCHLPCKSMLAISGFERRRNTPEITENSCLTLPE